MSLIYENAARIARMSGEQVMELITELSQFLTQSEINRVSAGYGEIAWKEEDAE